MKAIDDNIPCYAWADQSAVVLQRLSFLDVVGYLAGPDKQGFTEILLADGRIAYCQRSSLAWKSSRLYAQPLAGEFASVLPGQQDVLLKSRLVDVRQHAPDIQIDLLFATKRNFTGINLYGRSICMLQEDTLKKLIKAQAIFRQDGYCIKLIDAYRPYSVTLALSAYNSNPIYLADPATGSHHNRGVAVDMTLVDLDGCELEMPSRIHTLNETSSRNNPDMTEAARRNLDYMSAVMVSCGFRIFQHEWWHFTDTNRLSYPVMDFLMTDFKLVENTQKIRVTPPPLRDPDQSGYVSVSPTPTPSPTVTPTDTPPEPALTPAATAEPDPSTSPTP
jgi:D-alanyl-D-alanine dipeptidase